MRLFDTYFNGNHFNYQGICFASKYFTDDARIATCLNNKSVGMEWNTHLQIILLQFLAGKAYQETWRMSHQLLLLKITTFLLGHTILWKSNSGLCMGSNPICFRKTDILDSKWCEKDGYIQIRENSIKETLCYSYPYKTWRTVPHLSILSLSRKSM